MTKRIPRLTLAQITPSEHAGQIQHYMARQFDAKYAVGSASAVLNYQGNQTQELYAILSDKLNKLQTQPREKSLLDLSEWSECFRENNEPTLVLISLANPNIEALLLRIIRWAQLEHDDQKDGLYIVATVPQQALDNTLVKAAIRAAGASVEIYEHIGQHDKVEQQLLPKKQWLPQSLVAVLTILIISAAVFYIVGYEKEPLVKNNDFESISSADEKKTEQTTPTETWQYRLDVDWYKDITAQSQVDEGNNAVDISDSDKAETTTKPDDSSTKPVIAKQPLNETYLAFGQDFQQALQQRDDTWFQLNTEPLLNWTSVDGTDDSALHALALAGQSNWLMQLLDNGANVDVLNALRWTPLVVSAIHGKVEVAQSLLAAGANPNIPTENGRTALMAAVHNQHADVAKLLVEADADVNRQANDGWTALLHAVWNKDVETVGMLLTAGADPQIETKLGETAFIVAEHRGNDEVINLLRSTSN